jgi:predicted nucleotidyltransferase
MRAARLDTILQEFCHGLEQIYGSRLVRVVLFGSQARDEAEPDSDIDVMLVLRGPVNPHDEIRRLSSFTSGLSLKHDVVISCVYMSEDGFYNEQSPLTSALAKSYPLCCALHNGYYVEFRIM